MSSRKTAIITGITGQDGAYLSSLLLKQDYQVIGLVRSKAHGNFQGLRYVGAFQSVIIEECDLLDLTRIITLLNRYQPDEIYNLAAQSSVSVSFEQPIGTFQFNTLSVFNLLEATRIINKKIKFYQASSSEMYGRVHSLPISESTVFHPLSPYAISKASAHWICVQYRESYNMFISCGILFNHESYLRSPNYFVKKVISESLRISRGETRALHVGNLDIKRDFGYAPKYVECMQLMLQGDEPGDFTICSGQSVSLRSIVEYIFEKLNIPLSACVVSRDLYRPSEIQDIYGDSTKAKAVLNWTYDLTFFNVLDLMLEEERRNLK
jgi:GDPmannose 4,6-dehydratase